MADKNGQNRILQLLDQGQSIWLDSIARGQLKSGGLKKLIDEDGIRGETANPSIFEKAIGGSSDYDQQIRELVNQGVAWRRAARSRIVRRSGDRPDGTRQRRSVRWGPGTDGSRTGSRKS